MFEDKHTAFRSSRHTQYHIFFLRWLIEKTSDRNGNIFLTFLNIQAAFVSVPRHELWRALKAKNVPRHVVYAAKSAYQNPNGIFRIDRETRPLAMEQGVKQGDSLRPLLFLNFMDEIPV